MTLPIAALCAILAAGADDAAAPALPTTISASCTGDFASGSPWYLSINSAGDAELTVFEHRLWARHHFKVPAAEMDRLRALLDEVSFFDLDQEYGEEVLDGSLLVLTISQPHRTREVRIRYLMNWVHQDRQRLRAPARALKVFLLVRNWFDVPEAADTRTWDRQAVQAAPDR